MKTRIQLANGLMADTLTADEKKVAEANPVVMSMVKSMQATVGEDKTETKKTSRKKGTEDA